MSFWGKDCVYCGATIKTIGLDRYDNSIGYTQWNVVPCCGMCNQSKMDRTTEEFIRHCTKVAEKHRKHTRADLEQIAARGYE